MFSFSPPASSRERCDCSALSASTGASAAGGEERPGEKAASAPRPCLHAGLAPFLLSAILDPSDSSTPRRRLPQLQPSPGPFPPKVPKSSRGIWTAVSSILIPLCSGSHATSCIVRDRHAGGQETSPSDEPKRWGRTVATSESPGNYIVGDILKQQRKETIILWYPYLLYRQY
ncbi:hypothetical protein P7K49_025965 [Saguinus oedipus]|uniref:Uncharacterized protein n=1 Tax=Saguinus oedipus TaxID=9490 RepID=A0ABQ9UIQ4_SAGOE|nr:hypothetical protein P7K49_025965 [Saguinus oedipus]